MSLYNQKLQIFINFAVVLAMVADLLFPKVSFADEQISLIVDLDQQQSEKKVILNEAKRLPKAKDIKPRKIIYVTVTAYSSDVYQCDSTPFITASGTHVRDGIVAANFLKFGTKVRFPEYSGDKVYTVEDRMNIRFPYRIDIWMPSKKQAKEFGVKRLKMEIF